MKTFKTLHNERGFVLLTVYVVAIFVTILSIALFARHWVSIQATERYQNRILAFNAAESGIDFALRRLSTDSALRSQTEAGSYTSSFMPMSQNEFRFTVSPVAGRSSFRRIDSEGCAPNCDNTSRGYQTSNITVYCQITSPAPPPSLFEYGVYGVTSISLSGNKTSAFDSYNSNQGAYGGSNISSAGGIALNSTSADTIVLKNTTVKGDVLVGYGGNPDAVIDLQKAAITGTRSTLPQDWSVPDPVTLPETHTEVNLSNVSGNSTITLAPGTYHTSSLKVSGTAKIVTTGAVKIYVDGAIEVTGNGITVPNNHPANLLLFSTGSSSVKIAGNGSFYGGVYAPNSAITATGNGDVFGAVIGKTFTQTGNSAFHFDLAMKELQVVDPNQIDIVRITAWQELHSLAWGTGKEVSG